jgi:carbamate kinase
MPDTRQLLVVALGGNAISAPDRRGTIEEQFAQTQKTARFLAEAVVAGYQLVLTHGNGPQVGNVMRRVELARTELYPLPLEVCVADTQAGMGYMIAQCLMNELIERDRPQSISTIVTSVLVDRLDPAFLNPSKPIGPRLIRNVAEAHRLVDGWHIQEEGPEIFRRVVPSPKPRDILEINTIRRIVEDGEHVICCGGGGIPVYLDETGRYQGAAAVIDKDLTTSLLARELGVSTVVILTGTEYVCLDFGTLTQRTLTQLTLPEAERYLVEDQFGAGSMRPKIEAAIDFLTHSRAEEPQVIIADLNRFSEALAGTSGTRIVRQ